MTPNSLPLVYYLRTLVVALKEVGLKHMETINAKGHEGSIRGTRPMRNPDLMVGFVWRP